VRHFRVPGDRILPEAPWLLRQRAKAHVTLGGAEFERGKEGGISEGLGGKEKKKEKKKDLKSWEAIIVSVNLSSSLSSFPSIICHYYCRPAIIIIIIMVFIRCYYYIYLTGVCIWVGQPGTKKGLGSCVRPASIFSPLLRLGLGLYSLDLDMYLFLFFLFFSFLPFAPLSGTTHSSYVIAKILQYPILVFFLHLFFRSGRIRSGQDLGMITHMSNLW